MKHDPDTVFTEWQGPLGHMILAATARGLSGIWFEGQRHGPDTTHWQRVAHSPLLKQAMDQLQAYFDGQRTAFSLPLDLQGGTAFQQRVWQALLEIAPGGTTSYGALSERIGHPAAVRAVGAAVGRNPVSIVVPCHRVIGANGSLTGYAGGLDRKTSLLALEGAVLH